MDIHIRYFGQARQAALTENETVSVPDGATPREVLTAAAAARREAFRKLVFNDSGAVRGSMLLAAGEAVCEAEQSGILKHNTELTVFSALSGG